MHLEGNTTQAHALGKAARAPFARPHDRRDHESARAADDAQPDVLHETVPSSPWRSSSDEGRGGAAVTTWIFRMEVFL